MSTLFVFELLAVAIALGNRVLSRVLFCTFDTAFVSFAFPVVFRTLFRCRAFGNCILK